MKIFDIKENITSRQRLILLVAILILIIVISSILMSQNFRTNKINYKKVDKYTFIADSVEDNDRNIYWTLNNIITEFLKSYQTVEKMDTSLLVEYKYMGYSLSDYYLTLDPDYKKFLGKKKYIEKSKELMSKMVTTNENGYVMKEKDIIKNVYKLNSNSNAYLCELKAVNEFDSVCIGIILDTEKNQFNIFYME